MRRYSDNLKVDVYEDGNWTGVDVFRKYLFDLNLTSDDTKSIDEIVEQWLKENISGEYKKIQRLDYIFREKSDAMLFKITWG